MHKVVVDGYIISVSNSNIGVEISEEEYSQITKAIKNKPSKAGYFYKLRNDTLTWEEFEIIVIPEEVEELQETETI